MTENKEADNRQIKVGDGSNYNESIERDYIQGNAYYICNYYYREDVRVTPVKPADASDEDNLPCPYRGLFHFGPDDAEFFFGREVFVSELFEATQNRNFLPVLGASGSGKSSVVLAGLVPRLQQAGHWKFTHFRPGSDPFHALAESLVPLYEPDKNKTEQMHQARQLAEYFVNGSVPVRDVFSQIERNYPNHRVLLIADQFEELYTLCPDQKIRHSFLDILLASFQASSGNTNVLVATLRADFLGNALSYPQFGDVLRNADVKIRSMNREELSRVIEEPALKLGVTFEAGLVDRILNHVENEPGNLPLLEFALTLLWNQRTGKQLTHAAYQAIGEVQGALASYADQKYSELSSPERELVRRIFIQLVRPGEGVEDTRRLATKIELGETSWSLLKKLADTRLIVTSRNAAGQETVEVVHEALIRNWKELRQWMETDRSFRTWQEGLRVAMRQWEQTQRDSGALLRGAALVYAEEKLRERPEELSQADLGFIETSIILRDTEKQEQERRRRSSRNALIISLVGALSLSGFAFWQWRQAEKRRVNAEVLAQSLTTENLFVSGFELDALLSGLKAWKKLKKYGDAVEADNRTKTIVALQQVVYELKERNRLEGHSDSVYSVVFSPDGKTIATGSDDKTVKLWNLSGQVLHTFTGHSDKVESVVFSPDGKTIATGSDDKTVKLWNLSGQVLHTFTGHSDKVESVVFSPDGKTIATGSDDKTVKLWNLSGQVLHTFTGHSGVVNSVVFSPDGKTIASASEDKTVKLLNLSGQVLHTFTGHSGVVNSVVFSPDGKTIASASEDKTVKLWNLSGQVLQTLHGHSDKVISVAFSPDGKTIASGSDDHTVKLWNLSGQVLHTFTGHSGWVYSVVFSPDGKTIASGSDDHTVKLWNLSGQERQTLHEHSGIVNSVVFSPDGKTIASGSDDKTVKLLNLSGQVLQTLHGHSDKVESVVFSPDGKTIATGSWDKTVKLWNLSGQELHTLKGHSGIVNSVVFSPDGKTIASGSWDKTVKLWNLSGQELHTLKGHSGAVYSVVFSPDGKTIATGSDDKTVKLWNLSGQELHTLKGHSGAVYSVVFSPDGKTIATGSKDNTVKLLNLSGQVLQTLHGHSGWVYSVVFSPDGKTIASASEDKTVKLWNLSGQVLQTLHGHSDKVRSVAFSPDDKTIASASWDKTVKLWNLDLDDLLRRGCDWVDNYLKNDPNVKDEDRHLCDHIAKTK